MKQIVRSLAAVGACAGLLSMAGPAQATAVLDFNFGALTIVDNGAGDSCAVVGVVCYIGSVGGFDVSVTTGRSFSPDATQGIDLVFAALGTGVINMRFGDTDFAGSAGTIMAESSIGGTLASGASICWQSGISSTDTPPFGGIDQTGAVRCASTPPASFGSTAFDSYTTIGDYALLQGITITHTTRGLTTGDYSVSIPEPATLALLGLGLAGLGFVTRRKQA